MGLQKLLEYVQSRGSTVIHSSRGSGRWKFWMFWDRRERWRSGWCKRAKKFGVSSVVWGDLRVNEAQEDRGKGRIEHRGLRGAEPECQLALVAKDSQLLRYEWNHERAVMLRWDKRWRSDANEAAVRSKIMSDVTDQSYTWTLKSSQDSKMNH